MAKSSQTEKLIDHPDFEIYKPMRITWVGFIVAWVVVIATIVGTMFIARIGA